eukprot:6490368-Amphidinium_carterae.3
MLLEWLIWLWGLMELEQRHCFIHTLVVPPKGHEQVMQTSMGAYNSGQGLGHADLNVYKPFSCFLECDDEGMKLIGEDIGGEEERHYV